MSNKKYTNEAMALCVNSLIDNAMYYLVHNSYKPARVQARVILKRAISLYRDITLNTLAKTHYKKYYVWCTTCERVMSETYETYADTICLGDTLRVLPTPQTT